MKVLCADAPKANPPKPFKMPTLPHSASLKRLEAARVARLKKAGQAVKETLKAADIEARELWLQELRDVQQLAEEVLRAPAPEDQPAEQ